MSKPEAFDPYALFEVLDRERFSYVVVGGFARVVHGSGETTRGLDVVPSRRPENLRRLARALDELGATSVDGGPVQADELTSAEPVTAQTRAGELTIVPEPWGTRGYDDLRIRAVRENLGRGARPAVASMVDCVRMLGASDRDIDAERLQRFRRVMELERQLTRHRGLRIER
jgi:hypothetical protein